MSYEDPNFSRNPNQHGVPDQQPLSGPIYDTSKHLLQDCDKGLAAWLAESPYSMRHAREAAAEIAAAVQPVAVPQGAGMGPICAALVYALRQIEELGGQWNNGIWAANIARAAIAKAESAALAAAPAAPAASTGWTGNADADLALILLDRLDDTGEGNAARIEQLEGLVRRLAAAPAAPAPVLVPLTDVQVLRMWRLSTFRGSGGQADWFAEGVRAAEHAHGIVGKP